MASKSNSPATETIWIPLESDPGILTTYLQSLSLTGHYLIDVPVIDGAEEMGFFTGHNVKAFIFLYQINSRSEEKAITFALESPPGLYHMQQLILNSCGTVALLHAYLNTVESAQFEPSSILAKYFQETANLDYAKRGKVFADNEQLRQLHYESAVQGQSQVPRDLKQVELHYVAIVPFKGTVYKLDGRCLQPIPLGVIADGVNFKSIALEAIKEMMKRDPDNHCFSVLAFCGN